MTDDQDSKLGAQSEQYEALFTVRMIGIGNNTAILVIESGFGLFE